MHDADDGRDHHIGKLALDAGDLPPRPVRIRLEPSTYGLGHPAWKTT